MGKFNQKYRIESARLRNWDYAWAGLYFITICTKRRDASRLFHHTEGHEQSGRRDASRLFHHTEGHEQSGRRDSSRLFHHTEGHEQSGRRDSSRLFHHTEGHEQSGRRDSSRLYNWFGEIEGGIMRLSDIGKIVETEWHRTFELRPDMNLYMGEYVVMPDHFHAIIGIGENGFNMKMAPKFGDAMHPNCTGRDAMHRVSTSHTPPPTSDIVPPTSHTPPPTSDIVSPTSDIVPPKNQFGPQSKNLASIVRGFKSAVTKNARLINPDFAWQSRFYDRIIWDYAAYQRVANYIKHNPANWML